MKTKKYVYRLSGMLLSIATFFVLGAGHAAAAPLTCTWTGAGSDSKFSTAANWSNCNSAAPLSGDSLIFDGSASNKAPANDIGGLTIANITFTNAAGFTVSGVNITLTGGITDNSTGSTSSNTIALTLTLSGNQSITGTQVQPLVFGSLPSQLFSISSGTVTVGNVGGITVNSALSGTGGIVFSTSGSSLMTPASNFSGPITIDNGVILNADPTDLGSGSITIVSGGTLALVSAQSNITINNPITMGGTGFRFGAIYAQLGSGTGGKLTFAGPVTLTSDTTIDPSSADVFVTGTYTPNGFKLTAATGTVTIGSASTASSTKAAPKAPNTGLAAVKSNPLVTLAVATASAVVLVAFAFRTRKASVQR